MHRLHAAACVVLAATLGSCGPHHHLADYSFAGRALALVYIAPPAPVLLQGRHTLRTANDPVAAVMRAGSGVAREIAGRRASARLDSAAAHVDMAQRFAHAALERTSRYLGTRAVEDDDGADYVLEVQMRNVGIDARGESAAYLFTNAQVVLLDRRTGTEIWSTEVHGTDRLTPFVRGTDHVPGGIITAGTLDLVTVADFEQALQQLADFSSTLVSDELRSALRDVRR
ncbi:MAG TPA: hypothetical protein VFK13_03135 [Gemmatimonadaceae bacterium]|nr:hypothetical protein [Gemmatimonadaceae bacterium]